MATATLTVHTKGDRVVPFDELPAEAPRILGPKHRPIAHRALGQTLLDVLDSRGMEITRQEWALGNQKEDGSWQRMFGVMTIQPRAGDALARFPDEMTAAIGIRHANDMSEALKLVAGMYVFVCSNLSMFGQGDAAEFRKLHTSGLNLEKEIDAALDRTFLRFSEANDLISKFKEIELTDLRAKEVVYDAFTNPETGLPNRLFPDVHRFYFAHGKAAWDAIQTGGAEFLPYEPSAKDSDRPVLQVADYSDVSPRSMWGLSNAFTRAIREQPIGRQIGSSLKTMKVLAKAAGQ
jgi:hypothetical protein